MSDKFITLAVELTEAEAWALAQFMKRIGFTERRQHAVDDDEAYLMGDGCEKITKALAEKGYAPR